jgi:hypothetical protein
LVRILLAAIAAEGEAKLIEMILRDAKIIEPQVEPERPSYPRDDEERYGHEFAWPQAAGNLRASAPW